MTLFIPLLCVSCTFFMKYIQKTNERKLKHLIDIMSTSNIKPI